MTGLLRSTTFMRWLPVIVLPPILLLDGVLSEKGDPVDLLSVVLAYVATLPLALRERLGFFGMAPLLVGGVVLVLWDFEPGTTVVPGSKSHSTSTTPPTSSGAMPKNPSRARSASGSTAM